MSARRRFWLWVLFALSLLSAAAPAAEAPADASVLRPPAQLRADGMPDLHRPPADVAAANDAEPPAHRLVGWHPHRDELLLLTRRGSSAQLHRLSAPRLPPWQRRLGAVAGLALLASGAAWLAFHHLLATDTNSSALDPLRGSTRVMEGIIAQ